MRGRYAPSPTGALHLGNARTALLAWLQVRAAGGRVVLRVEDLDRDRLRPGAEDALLADLDWLGLDWDEGPAAGGPHAPYRQSQRLAHYQAALDTLWAKNAIFECYCSRADVRLAASAPHGPSDDGPRYSGTCRELTARERASRSSGGRRPSLRFRASAGVVHFSDLVHGDCSEDVAAQVGDFVVRRADGVFAYQLAVVVDDAAMAISHVLRGDDLLGSTARQILLHRALGTPRPVFAHVPLIVGPDGVRLSKRHGAVSVAEWRAAGKDATEVIGLLGASIGLCEAGTRARPEELVARFDISALEREATTLDREA